jgi:hypothetical protein
LTNKLPKNVFVGYDGLKLHINWYLPYRLGQQNAPQVVM